MKAYLILYNHNRDIVGAHLSHRISALLAGFPTHAIQRYQGPPALILGLAGANAAHYGAPLTPTRHNPKSPKEGNSFEGYGGLP